MTASIAKTVTEADIILFAGVSTDVNPAHLDEEYRKDTVFGTRIAHGMPVAGFISAVLANHPPGPGTIYLSQTLKFKAPVRPGDTVRPPSPSAKSMSPKPRRARYGSNGRRQGRHRRRMPDDAAGALQGVAGTA